MSELSFIESIKRQQMQLPAGCVGIGDDAAVIEAGANGGWVIATDMLLEGRHFDTELHQLEDIGHKALAVNLSDLAAMAATARYALVSLAVPEGFGMDGLERVWRGLQRLAADFNVVIVGGDTNAWQDGLVINVCVLGVPHAGGSVLRSGAKAGDELYVTGPLGASLEMDHHLRFRPKLKEAAQLLDVVRPTAMIDISDGLSTDLRHICSASGVGAELQRAAIPISPRIPLSVAEDIRLKRALSDGEDFELLFSLAPEESERLQTLPFTCHKIGIVCTQAGIRIDGLELANGGFEHQF